MQFSVDHRVEKDLTIVTIRGEIDVFTSPRLRETLLDIIDEGRLHLIIDLGEVTFLDSTGLGVLVGIYHRLRGRDGSMAFVGVNDRVRRVFHITQLTKIFVLHRTLDEAIAAHESAAAAQRTDGSTGRTDPKRTA
ncbi:anti-sigma-B factor antagonist [Actinomadura rubrobrunea]|uniref:Anti-sigma factor antagonist n=1 Tax=Actinomadura rubrobrunea TaxID=115335 RepID=A0A9W6PSL5_9ACTN|nr:STAS domain-containing protein [Actinomadura rubrobrunea]GLW63794.1 anti-sigma-B factor antagonist [Actinomadura rubrobrunea]